MDGRFIKVAVKGEHFYLKGKIFVPDGYRGRVSDIANNNRRFLPVIAEEINLMDKEIADHFLINSSKGNKVLIINKDIIHFIIPLEETGDYESKKLKEGEREVKR